MKAIFRAAMVAVLLGVIVVGAQAKGYVVADKGNCVTVEFHYDEKGNFIGTSTTTGKCNVPDGVYPFRLVGSRAVKSPTPVDTASGRPLAASSPLYQMSLVAVEQFRAMAGGNANARMAIRSVTLPREYAAAMEAGLRQGTVVTVLVPLGSLPPSAER